MSLDNQDKEWISEQLSEQLERMSERLRLYVDKRFERVETKLLPEFHKWASPAEMRALSHTAAIRALDVEIESIDDRLRKLEGRQ
jgi:hypothetical protein